MSPRFEGICHWLNMRKNAMIKLSQNGKIMEKDKLMSAKTQTPDAALYTYRIASADMKFIEINTREIYLRIEPGKGYIIRGEMPECGPVCYANINQVFLEYAMSCQGFEGDEAVMESTVHFGGQLGEKFAHLFLTQHNDLGPEEIAELAFDTAIQSMGVLYKKERSAETLEFNLRTDPLEKTADAAGLHLWIDPAFEGFVAFFEIILKSIGGGWQLHSPKIGDETHSLQTIRLKRTV
jgi:hypothetical protein